jgi:hypothetical protein
LPNAPGSVTAKRTCGSETAAIAMGGREHARDRPDELRERVEERVGGRDLAEPPVA